MALRSPPDFQVELAYHEIKITPNTNRSAATTGYKRGIGSKCIGGGTRIVGIDVQGQVKKFGIQLTEPEAQEVVRELKPYLPS